MVIMDNNTIQKPASGKKYIHPNGTRAIKDGIKVSVETSDQVSLKKPNWFKVKVPSGKNFLSLKNKVNKLKLSSVCEESKCPNIGECWNHKTATLMVMGSVCTRACKFCSVDTGNPKGWFPCRCYVLRARGFCGRCPRRRAVCERGECERRRTRSGDRGGGAAVHRRASHDFDGRGAGRLIGTMMCHRWVGC